MVRWRGAAALVVAVSAALLSGCGVIPGLGAEPRPVATPVSELICDGSGESPAAGAVPAGFDPVSFYRCDWPETIEDDAGVWSGVLVTRFDGDLDPLVRALAEPDDARSLGACAEIGYVVPDMWLADAGGRYIRVSYPVTGCGAPKTERVDAAIEALDAVEERFERAQLIESRAAMDAGCATQADVLVLADPGVVAIEESDLDSAPAPGATGAPGAGVPWQPPALPDPAVVDGMLICEYAPAAGDGDTTSHSGDPRWFAGARRLDQDAAHEVLTTIVQATPYEGRCDAAAARFVVVHPQVGGAAASASVIVELDGCRRIVDAGLRASAVPDALLPLLGP